MTGVAGDTLLQSDVLEDLSTAVNYRRWLVSLALPYLGARMIEVGSGTGNYAEEWEACGADVTASEADPARLADLAARFAGHHNVKVRKLVAPIPAGAAGNDCDPSDDYDAVVAYNVLEHITDDVEALRAFARLARPGGAVIIVVPAFPALMSRFDHAIGHQRRYRKAALAAAISAAGLVVEEIRYLNAPGLAAWFIGMRLLGMRPTAGPLLRIWDGAVIPAVRRVEDHRRPPFGQSIFAVARRPAAAEPIG